jgi:rubrerythrin
MPIWALERLFEPPASIEARLREKKAAVRRNQDGGEGDPPSPRFRCRVCGHEWSEPAYCPVCLADTMEKVARPH